MLPAKFVLFENCSSLANLHKFWICTFTAMFIVFFFLWHKSSRNEFQTSHHHLLSCMSLAHFHDLLTLHSRLLLGWALSNAHPFLSERISFKRLIISLVSFVHLKLFICILEYILLLSCSPVLFVAKRITLQMKKKWKCDWNVNTSSRKIITKMIKYVLLCDSVCLWATFSCELFVTSYLIVCDCMERNVTSLSDLNYFSWKIVSSRILSSIQNYIFYEI